MTRRIAWIPLSLAILMSGCGGDAPEPDTTDLVEDTTVVPEPEPGLDLIELPEGFAPEGIAIGDDYTFYVGSLSGSTMGQILTGDLRTGALDELVRPTQIPALGIKFDRAHGLLFVAGGGSGSGRVYDAATGEQVVSYTFGDAPASINDVELTGDAAYFTDSALPAVYRVAMTAAGPDSTFTTIDLPEAFATPGSCPNVPAIQGNGIAATADGRYLILIHMSEGVLYRLDTASGAVTPIGLGSGNVCSADGLLLDGNRLYAVQNMMNQVAVLDLAPDFASGQVVGHITEPFASNPAIRIPTTIAQQDGSLYAVTAGFAEPAPDYIVRMDKLR